jgi:hypothetical protein
VDLIVRIIVLLSLTYPSEKLVETVGAAVTLMESMMAEVGHFNSEEQHIIAAIKNSIDFEWIRCTGCTPPTNNRWYCEMSHKNLYSLVV